MGEAEKRHGEGRAAPSAREVIARLCNVSERFLKHMERIPSRIMVQSGLVDVSGLMRSAVLHLSHKVRMSHASHEEVKSYLRP